MMITQYKAGIRYLVFLSAICLSGTIAAQYPNPDATLSFARPAVAGTARTAGAGGAFSSVGADLSSMELNPAGLGLFEHSEICVTPGIRIAADQSSYNGSNSQTSHPSLLFAQAGAVWTKKFTKPKRALNSITFGFNYQTENSFDRNQGFSFLNKSHSLIDNYASVSNQAGTNLWGLESQLFSLAGIMGQTQLGYYTSNVKAPVQQTGNIYTRGGVNKIGLGFGANVNDKLYFGLSVGIPILNYSVNTQVSETNANPNDSVTHFQNYQLSSNVSESGVGVTGTVGLIYKPAPWVRFGASYTLPTWYFINQNYSSDLIFAFDTIYPSEVGPGSFPELSYRLRTPMKGTAGASFYLQDHGFISVDYEFQNIGSTHYSISDTSYVGAAGALNNYMKTTYGYSHTVRVGIEGAIKKLRLRAGYSYTNSPLKKGQNYTDAAYNASVQSATAGIGFRFKVFYLDLAYVFAYTKDGVSPNGQIPLDQINSKLTSHNILLTLGFKIGSKNNSSSSPPKKRNSDQLPRYIDPGDKY